MRIVFVGAVDFSLHCLRQVLAAGGNVVAVLTPSAEHGSGNADYSDLGPIAEQHRIPLKRFGRIDDPGVVSYVRGLSPDVMFVFGLSQMIGLDMLAIPRMGVIGTHPTLLPEGRGRHPLIWALVKDLPRSGLTFFYMDTGADTGDILWQKPFSIEPDDTAAVLYKKIKQLASEAIAEFLPRLAAGTAPRVPQDHARATVWRKRSERDGEIDWSRPTRDVHNLVRALAKPYVGAHTFLGAEKMIIWRSRTPDGMPDVVAAGRTAPGTILECRPDALKVRTGDGTIELIEWQPKVHAALLVRAVLGRPDP